MRSIMNEIGEDTTVSLLDEDTIRLDDYIKSVIPEAVSMIVQVSDRCVNPKSSTNPVVHANEDGSGMLELPDDFIKLIALQMQGWKRIVSMTYPLGGETHKQQCNMATRAGRSKPVAILSVDSQGKRVIEYYSLPKGEEHVVSMFVYEAAFNEDEGLNMDIGNSLFGALCYMCASLVYSIFENAGTAAEMQKVAINLIGGQNG